MAEMNGVEFKIKVSADDAAKATQKLTSAMGGLNKTLKSTSTSKATTALSRFSASAKKAARSILSMPFKRAAESAGGFATKLGSVVSSFKRVMFYRMVRTVIREIGDAFKYGVNNLYAWSNALGGEFAASMDRIATSFAYFKNSVGAAVAPLINALAPAIDFVIDKAVALLNVINQLFARLTGASYWTRATKQAQSYGGAVSDAGGAATEALRYLAPFDELNVLPSDSSGGGGGGGGGSGAGGLFEDMVEFDQGIADFADQIRAAIEAGDWQGLGELLGGKLNELVDKVDWAKLGQKFGKGINAIISTEYWTLKEINFTNIGDSIATFVNNALSNIDFDVAGRLPVRKFTAVVDTIIGFLGGLDWWRIGDSIGSFVRGSLSEITEWFNDKDWEQMGEDLINNVVALFDGLDVVECAKSFGRFMEAVIKAGWNLAVGAITAIGGKISEAFQNAFESEDGVNFTYLANGQAFQFDSSEWQNRVENAVTASNIILDVKANITDVNDALTGDKRVIDNMTSRFSSAQDNIPSGQKNVSTVSKFTSAQNKLTTTQSTIATKANFTSYKKGFGSYVDAKANLTTYKKAWGKYIDTKANLTSYYRDWTGGPWIDTKANLTNYYRDWSGAPWINAKANITSASASSANGIVVAGGLTLYTKALGGAFFGGKWHDIPQYASGTLNAGSMFVAGEAGPELVGHINGRTEVLNASQIASAIAAGVSSATYYSEAPQIDEEAMYRAFIRALNDSDSGDIYLDGDVLYRHMVSRNRQNTRMTGVNAFA